MLLVSIFFHLIGTLSGHEMLLLRNVFGLTFVYLASTSLFRIYPQAVLVQEKRALDPDNRKNRQLIDQLNTLLIVDKVYQEAQYGRKDFARELDISEAAVSSLINYQFKETVPQLLNRYRVQEAKGLLKDTKIQVQVIAQEVGFNSLTTFNRVFKERVGVVPSKYR